VAHSKTAFAYYRTSSAANVGDDKDTVSRQRTAVEACARQLGYTIEGEFYDADVSGADPVDSRPNFFAKLKSLLANSTRTVIVENASRLARDLIVQETTYLRLKTQGIEIIAADAPHQFLAEGPTAEFIRQVLGAVAQLEKAMLVEKLRGARDRKSAKLGHRVEGAKRLGKLPRDAIRATQAAHEAGMSIRAIPAHLSALGFLSREGTPFGATSVARMLKRAG
jgi:DNA invertase Pin-like site-specific DNA recombinase